jgi:uroporphyrinogen-III synthase
MRILLTRAKADAQRTATKLGVLGHQAIISPVIEVVATGAALPNGAFDAIIATSAHALTTGARSLAKIPLYAVGERTREAAERGGWSAPVHVRENAQALIALLRSDLPRGQHVLYLAGRDRKPDIEAAAQEIGLDLQLAETYAAHQILSLTSEAEGAVRDGDVDAVLHYSHRSAELFIALVKRAELWPQAALLRHYALSNDVATPLIAAGAQTFVAAEPHEDDLLALLPRADRG